MMIGMGIHLLAGQRGTTTVEAYEPSWVDNTGTGWLSYDGSAVGADSAYFDMVFLVRSLDTNPSSTCRVFQTHGARIDVYLSDAGILSVNLNDATGTPLVQWRSTGAQDGTGDWLFHFAGNLTGTPSFAVSKCELTAGVPGSWSSVAGTFPTGPIVGTIDNARGGFAGNEVAVLATTAGGNISDCGLAYLWWSQAEPLADAAFADGGELFDPATIGTPAFLVTGPVADLDTDKGSAAKTMLVNGTWTDS